MEKSGIGNCGDVLTDGFRINNNPYEERNAGSGRKYENQIAPVINSAGHYVVEGVNHRDSNGRYRNNAISDFVYGFGNKKSHDKEDFIKSTTRNYYEAITQYIDNNKTQCPVVFNHLHNEAGMLVLRKLVKDLNVCYKGKVIFISLPPNKAK